MKQGGDVVVPEDEPLVKRLVVSRWTVLAEVHEIQERFGHLLRNVEEATSDSSMSTTRSTIGHLIEGCVSTSVALVKLWLGLALCKADP
jgi:hypothetical protein